MKVLYRDIEGFNERYTISNNGKVYDKQKKRFKKLRIVKQKNRNATIYADLFVTGTKKTSVTIHTLVAKYFVENPNNYINVWHKDRNILNNNAWNLIWIDTKLTRHLTCKNQFKGGRHKLKTDIEKTIQFLKNLDKKGTDEINILKYYENDNTDYIWKVYLNNQNKLSSFDSEIVYNAFEYYIDRVKRGIVCNYQFKILLECINYEQKKNICQTNLI